MTASTAKALTLHEWAVAVDTVLADLWDVQDKARYYRRSHIDTLHRVAGHYHRYLSRGAEMWTVSRTDNTRVGMAEAVQAVTVKAINPQPDKPWIAREAQEALNKLAAYDVELEALDELVAEFQAEWTELRWSRFFLVKNNNGHIHSSTACSTCFPTTRFGWLPELSGLTEKDAVDAHGTILCSVCFPSAPVEWTLGKQRDTSKDCPISGQTVSQVFGSWEDAKPHFRYSGRGGYLLGECPGKCGQRGVAVTSTFKVRKHQKKET